MALLKRRSAYLVTSVLLGIVLLVWYHAPYGPSTQPLPRSDQYLVRQKKVFDGIWNYMRDRDNLLLDSSECEQAFPGLFDETKRPMKDRRSRKISLAEIDSITPRNGYVRAMIYDQQVGFALILYILNNVNETPTISYMSLPIKGIYTPASSLLCMLCIEPSYPLQSSFPISNLPSTQMIG